MVIFDGGGNVSYTRWKWALIYGIYASTIKYVFKFNYGQFEHNLKFKCIFLFPQFAKIMIEIKKAVKSMIKF